MVSVKRSAITFAVFNRMTNVEKHIYAKHQIVLACDALIVIEDVPRARFSSRMYNSIASTVDGLQGLWPCGV